MIIIALKIFGLMLAAVVLQMLYFVIRAQFPFQRRSSDIGESRFVMERMPRNFKEFRVIANFKPYQKEEIYYPGRSAKRVERVSVTHTGEIKIHEQTWQPDESHPEQATFDFQRGKWFLHTCEVDTDIPKSLADEVAKEYLNQFWNGEVPGSGNIPVIWDEEVVIEHEPPAPENQILAKLPRRWN